MTEYIIATIGPFTVGFLAYTIGHRHGQQKQTHHIDTATIDT